MTRVAIPNAKPNPTTSTSSYVQIDSSPTTPALSQNAPVKEGREDKPNSIHSRKRVNGLSGLLVSRPMATSRSTSTSDSLNSGVVKDREESPRKTRGPAPRPTTNWSHGTKLRKSQGRIADQDELELWTNADVAHIGFRKPDELMLFDEVAEESTKKNVSHILTCLMEMEAKSSSENMARNEGEISNYVQNQIGHEDEKMRDDVNSPQVPPPQLECWSTTLRSLLKGKKKFQHQVLLRSLFPCSLKLSKIPFHQDLINLKDALQEIYNKRANISGTSSLAQEVYNVTQLEIHDVPNQDELGLRALARKSTQYWGIGGRRLGSLFWPEDEVEMGL